MARGNGRGVDDLARLRRILLNAYGVDRQAPSYHAEYQRINRELRHMSDLEVDAAISRTRRALADLLGVRL